MTVYEILLFSAYSIAFSLDGNFNITSSKVSVEVSQPINGLIDGSLVSNSKTHFFSFPRGKLKKWVLEFETKDPSINPLMGWETSTDTLEEVILKFPSKEKAIEYAENNNISYTVIEPKKKEFVIKSYADNFLKN